MTNIQTIEWVHALPSDDGESLMRRAGINIGDEFFHSHSGVITNGRFVSTFHTRETYRGRHEPEYGDADRGMVKVDNGAINVCIGGLDGNPKLCWPIAKVIL